MPSTSPFKKYAWVSPRDLLDLLRLPILALVAWTLPPRHWDRFTGFAAKLHARLSPRRTGFRRGLNEKLFADLLDPATLDSLVTDSIAHTYHARLQLLADYRPDRWQPEIEIVGGDQMERALARGQGVLLWVTPFVHSHLVTKKGLQQAGLRMSHLSRPEHGFSSSLFGKRLLNPICTRIEDRYLLERVRIDGTTDSRAALSILRDRLMRNQVVTITVGAQARKTLEVDFLKTTLRLATGPLHLALTSKAVLLPVFTVRTESGKFVITIERPLMADYEAPSADLYEAVIRRYVQRLEPYVLTYPSQSYQAAGLE